MASFNLSAFGVNRAIGNFDKTAKALDDRFLQDAALASAAQILPVAVGRAPRLTGALAGSGRTKKVYRTGAAVQFGGAKVRHAGPIHFGWPRRGIKAQPFLFAAMSIMERKVVENYEKAVEKIAEETSD